VLEEPQDQVAVEPPDHHQYHWVMFYADTFRFFRAAVAFYSTLLDRDIELIDSDPELSAILTKDVLASYPIARERDRVERMMGWFDEYIEKSPTAYDYDVRLSHGWARLIKSACMLYMQHIRNRRNALAVQSGVSKSLVDAIDQQLAAMDEKLSAGIFEHASPYPLAVDQLPDRTAVAHASEHAAPDSPPPRPVVLDTIEIRDPELRKRCLDLLAQFKEDGEHERLDTVLAEATRILEDRLRALSGAPTSCIGAELATLAFAGNAPALTISEEPNEQKSAHLLYLGTFGFVRNVVHHRLVGSLHPDRVLQIVGMIDYLIWTAEGARRVSAPDGSAAV